MTTNLSPTSKSGSSPQQQQSSKSGLSIAPGAIVCNGAEFRGQVSIGARTVIHPRVRIIAEAGPIIIGENNLLEEQTQIINSRHAGEGDEDGDKAPIIMRIGACNVFEVDSYCECKNVGDNNVLEAKAHVGADVTLTNGCIVGAACVVTAPEVIAENTVIYGDECLRRLQADRPPPQTLQLDFLTKILPNYHHILKKASKKDPSKQVQESPRTPK